MRRSAAPSNQGFGDFIMMPHGVSKSMAIAINLLIGLSLFTLSADGKHKKTDDPPFIYLAGTESVDKGCGGKLQVLKEGFTFKCATGGFSLPFSAITLMQYRPDVSEAVMAMKIPWKIAPQLARVRENKYFTIVTNEQGKLRAVVLRVDEDDMRPFFAEIELQSGKSVQEFRDFGEFN
ncbi:MAG: hypothetical protein ACLQVG_20785 [Terriglobia bacterium]